MNTDYENMVYELEAFEKQFRTACQQIVQLNRRLDEMSIRYDRANREGRRTFRYSLRLKIAVIEGVRNMYYDYAANKADQITDLRALMRMGDTMVTRQTDDVSSLELAEVMSEVENSDSENDSDSEVEMMSDDQNDVTPLYEDSDSTVSPLAHLQGHTCC